MNTTFRPASVRRNKRSYPAVRIIMTAPYGGSDYEHTIYSTVRWFDDGASARKNAAQHINSPDFPAEYYVSELKKAWGI